jgi:hypothetical protein
VSPPVKSAGMLLALHTIKCWYAVSTAYQHKESTDLVLQTQHAVLERVSRLFLKVFFGGGGGWWMTKMTAIQKPTQTTCFRCFGVDSWNLNIRLPDNLQVHFAAI